MSPIVERCTGCGEPVTNKTYRLAGFACEACALNAKHVERAVQVIVGRGPFREDPRTATPMPELLCDGCGNILAATTVALLFTCVACAKRTNPPHRGHLLRWGRLHFRMPPQRPRRRVLVPLGGPDIGPRPSENPTYDRRQLRALRELDVTIKEVERFTARFPPNGMFKARVGSSDQTASHGWGSASQCLTGLLITSAVRRGTRGPVSAPPQDLIALSR